MAENSLGVLNSIYVQARMAAAIAYMGGYEIHHDKVKTMVYLSLAGNAANEVVKEIGMKMAMDFAEKKISGAILSKVQQTVAEKIISKSATQLVKAIPIIGGIVSAGFDGVTTKAIGAAAKSFFIANPPTKELTRVVTESEVPDWAKKQLAAGKNS
ncbi:MAG: hypothetical protein J5809_06560 [Selenomonadaceae bacterium]|nr:hypothetical protein [Selenomonadaceae bacterium]